MNRTIPSGLLVVTFFACATEKAPAPLVAPGPAATDVVATPAAHATAHEGEAVALPHAEPVPPIQTRTLNGGPIPKSECTKDADCKTTERCAVPECHAMKIECMVSKCVPK